VREGAYLLRTNLPAADPRQLWTSYIQLTESEAAFRALQSELHLRPIFHQLERIPSGKPMVDGSGQAG